MEPGRHAGIGPVSPAKWMERPVEAAAAEVEAEPLDHAAQEFLLFGDVKSFENSQVGLPRGIDDGADQLDQGGLQLTEKIVDAGRREAGIMLIDVVIVGTVPPAEQVRLFPRQLNRFFQNGGVGGKIVLLPGQGPGMIGPRTVLGLFRHEPGRQLARPVIVAAGPLHHRPLVLRQPGLLRLQRGQPVPHLRPGEFTMMQVGQMAFLARPMLRAPGRQIDLLIPTEQAHGRPQPVGVFQRLEKISVVRISHEMVPDSSLVGMEPISPGPPRIVRSRPDATGCSRRLRCGPGLVASGRGRSGDCESKEASIPAFPARSPDVGDRPG